MRVYPLAILLMFGGPVFAQDAAQAMQMQQQQVLQQQLTQQQLQLVNQQLLDQNINAGLAGYQIGIRAPQLKEKAGAEPGTVVVRMEDRSRGASVFYTTDGWTPTAASQRYMGPITLRQNTTVRAIALAAGGVRSYVSTLPVEATSKTPVSLEPSPVRVAQLFSGTTLPLVFSASVSSRGMKVGDPVPVSLAEDLFIGGKLAAQKGAVIEAVVTHVDNSHVQGLPGVLSFAAQALHLQDGTKVYLLGVETKEGSDHTVKATIASIIPLGGLAIHGGDAIIAAGTRFDAEVTTASEASARVRQSK